MDPPFKQALTVNSVLLAFVGVTLIIGGVLSDKHGWRGLLRYPGIVQILLALPLFWCFGAFAGQWWPMALIQILLGTTLCLQVAALQMFLGGAIDNVGVRYSIGGIGYNIGLVTYTFFSFVTRFHVYSFLFDAFFGGTAPLVSEALAHFGTVYVGLYVLLCTLLSLVVAEAWYNPNQTEHAVLSHKYSGLEQKEKVSTRIVDDDVHL
ncbi:hypothetical protein RFI_31080 [Reticulomyxa filosa]|uniref:Uncharacterized protein n=1 Tax=Reticulomyxa filosa TaxID=46433 RepID=X6LYT2_RETFI|nr:hypothetical protein RFI_31080 [Reticulomyxa filosa]|eukprot:ETO06317.1 hypothetical protein RFI_31080 [Reticulomyxa filosa]